MKTLKVIENQVKSAVRQGLNTMGWWNWHNIQSLGSVRGLADRTAIKNGVVLWIECKAPGKKLSPKQDEFMKKIIKAGGHYIVARSFKDVRDYINDHGL